MRTGKLYFLKISVILELGLSELLPAAKGARCCMVDEVVGTVIKFQHIFEAPDIRVTVSLE